MDPADRTNPMSPLKRRVILLAMTGSLAMIFMDSTVVGVALPAIGESLGLGEQSVFWVVNAYLLTLASLIAIGGRIGDAIGKPLAFSIGVAVFAGSSLACGLAVDGTTLIAARIGQAVGAVLMQPASSAIAMSTAAPGAEGRTMGIYVGVSMLGLLIGPVLGGVLTEHLGWASIFYVNLPIAAAALGLVAWIRPPGLRDPSRRIPWGEALILATSLPLLIWGTQTLGTAVRDGWSWAVAGVPIGLLGLAWFVRRQFRETSPLIGVELLRDRGFLVDATLLGLMNFALTGAVINLSVLLQTSFGLEPLAAGMATLPLIVPVIFMLQAAGRLFDRIGVKPLAVPAAFVVAAAMVGLGFAAQAMSFTGLLVAMVALGGSIAFVNMPANTDGMRRFGPERRGLASGVLQTFRMTGATLGIAVTASVIAAFDVDSSTLDCGDVPKETLAAACRGDLQAFARVVQDGPSPCVEALKIANAEGTGWAFVVAGLVAGLGVIVALAWRPPPGP